MIRLAISWFGSLAQPVLIGTGAATFTVGTP